jgi:hypothetical protein
LRKVKNVATSRESFRRMSPPDEPTVGRCHRNTAGLAGD